MTDNTHPDLDRPATAEEIKVAQKLGACKEALAAARAGATVRDLITDHAQWLITYAPRHLTLEQLRLCARLGPRTALTRAANRLDPGLLDWCARKEPRYALTHAADRLDTKLLDWCKQRAA